MLRRHCLQTIAVQQWKCALEQEQYAVSPAIVDFAHRMLRVVSGSLVVEDAFNIAKNTSQMRGSKRMRVPEKTMGTVLGKELLTKRHHFQDHKQAPNFKEKTAALNLDTFGAGKRPAPSTDLAGIATTAAHPTYYSPAAFNIGETGADLAFLEHKRKDSKVDERKCQLSVLCNPAHHFIMRALTSDGTPEKQWYFPMHAYARSGVIMPCRP